MNDFRQVRSGHLFAAAGRAAGRGLPEAGSLLVATVESEAASGAFR